MLITDGGMFASARPLQSRKAANPMLVTPFGILMLFKPDWLRNAESPTAVTLPGITVEEHPEIRMFLEVRITALQFSLLS